MSGSCHHRDTGIRSVVSSAPQRRRKIVKTLAGSIGVTALAVAITLVLGAMILGCGSPAPGGDNATELAELHAAAINGDVDRIRDLLARDEALLHEGDENLQMALHHAVAAGHLQVAEMLLEEGADVAATDAEERTPLHVAAHEGDAAIVRLLLDNGADPMAREFRGRTALFLATNWGNDLETVRYLISAGADVNDRTSRGEEILLSTLYYGRPEIIDLLLESGALLPDDDESIGTAAYLGASNGLEGVFDLAVELAGERGLEWWNEVPFHAVARGGSPAIAEVLLARGGELDQENLYGVTPLHIAAEHGRTELVEWLLERGARIDRPTRQGKTALHIAQENGHDEAAGRLLALGASQDPPRFPETRGPYLGQPEPEATPLRFAPGIVSGHAFDSEHSPAVFSPDGNEVFWTSKFRGPILTMRQENGVWTAPHPVPFGSQEGDGEPIFTPDGQRLYFLSLRPLEPGEPSGKENIWLVERTPQGWSEPRPVSSLVNAFDHHWLFSVSDDETLYFASIRDGGFGEKDIYRSRFVDEVHQEPENLGEVINSEGGEHTPFIAPDESYIIFTSTGPVAGGGEFRFLISYSSPDGTWSTPEALSEEILDVEFSLCPSITPDGRFMFFIGEGDIWWVSADFIESMRPTNTPTTR
jgi:ankyrin repeat protein